MPQASGIPPRPIGGPDVAAMNSFEHPDVIGARDRRLEQGGGSFEHESAARSLGALRMRLR